MTLPVFRILHMEILLFGLAVDSRSYKAGADEILKGSSPGVIWTSGGLMSRELPQPKEKLLRRGTDYNFLAPAAGIVGEPPGWDLL